MEDTKTWKVIKAFNRTLLEVIVSIRHSDYDDYVSIVKGLSTAFGFNSFGFPVFLN